VGPVVLRVKLRYEDLDAMVQRFAPNIGKSGLFLPTKALQPIGTEVKFELRLANDTPVLVGLGRVKDARGPDPENPGAAYGISIALMRVSRDSRDVIIRMLERRRELGLPEVGVPLPDDIDVAREIRDSMASGPQVTPPPVVEQAAPKSRSAPVAAPIAELPPERQRTPRPRIEDLIGKATAATSNVAAPAMPELDEQVDVERALSRARALAGGDLDRELAALRETAAAPLGEISVEAASAELARQLGGRPIARRERSARAAGDSIPSLAAGAAPVRVVEAPQPEALPPLAVDTTPVPRIDPEEARDAAAEEFAAKTRAETEMAPSATLAAITDAAMDGGDGVSERAQSPSIVPREAYVLRRSEQFDSPYVEGENYRPQPANYGVEEPTSVPSGEEVAVPQSHPIVEEEDPDLAAFDAALEAARIHTGVSAPAPPAEDEEQEDEEAEAPLPPPVLDEFSSEMRPVDPYQGAQAYPVEEEEEEIEELDDMDVLAIEDDDEDDMISEATTNPPLPLPAPAPDDDFASRLDLGDDDERPEVDSYDERGAGYGAPRYGGGISFRPHDVGEDFDEPHRFSTPSAAQPRNLIRAPAEDLEQALSALDVDLDPSLRQQRRARVSPAPRVREESGPTNVREASGPTRVRDSSRPLPGLPVHRPSEEVPVVKRRAETDDGVMIDFDDDD